MQQTRIPAVSPPTPESPPEWAGEGSPAPGLRALRFLRHSGHCPPPFCPPPPGREGLRVAQVPRASEREVSLFLAEPGEWERLCRGDRVAADPQT